MLGNKDTAPNNNVDNMMNDKGRGNALSVDASKKQASDTSTRGRLNVRRNVPEARGGLNKRDPRAPMTAREAARRRQKSSLYRSLAYTGQSQIKDIMDGTNINSAVEDSGFAHVRHNESHAADGRGGDLVSSSELHSAPNLSHHFLGKKPIQEIAGSGVETHSQEISPQPQSERRTTPKAAAFKVKSLPSEGYAQGTQSHQPINHVSQQYKATLRKRTSNLRFGVNKNPTPASGINAIAQDETSYQDRSSHKTILKEAESVAAIPRETTTADSSAAFLPTTETQSGIVKPNVTETSQDIASLSTNVVNDSPIQSHPSLQLASEMVLKSNALPDQTKPAKSEKSRAKPDKPSKLIFENGESTPRNSDIITSHKHGEGRIAGSSDPNQKTAIKKAGLVQSKADRSTDRLTKAESNQPKNPNSPLNKLVDTENRKPGRKLHFRAESNNHLEHLTGPTPFHPAKMGVNAVAAYGHNRLSRAEQENVGVQAAHQSEILVERGLRKAYHFHKTRPYRSAVKLERKSTKFRARATHRNSFAVNQPQQKSLASRTAQKRRIKRQYSKATREAWRTGGRIKNTASFVGKATNVLIRAAVKNPKVLGIIALLCFPILMFMSLFASFSGLASNIGQTIIVSSFIAEDDTIDNASIAYTAWEAELRMRIIDVQNEFPGFNEYRFDVGDIGHNPIELIAYLTAVYQDFTYPNIRTALRELFDEQYQLTLTPSMEVRHFLNQYGYFIPFEWHVLTVTLASRSITSVVQPRMNETQRQHFDLLMQTGGSRQYVGSPFGFNWLPFVSSLYGYRVHPINGQIEFHLGVDIALPIGTEILAAHDGTVTFAGEMGGYGNLVIIEGRNGIETRYAHCDILFVSVGQRVSAGDVIAAVGNTGASTGPHLHFEVIRNGRRLNPLIFAVN